MMSPNMVMKKSVLIKNVQGGAWPARLKYLRVQLGDAFQKYSFQSGHTEIARVELHQNAVQRYVRLVLEGTGFVVSEWTEPKMEGMF